MSEFINRKQFIAATQSLHCETCDHRIDCLLCNVGRVIRKIINFPSADAAPVVHGRWIEITADVYKCSKCTQLVRTQDIIPYRFCNVCGAKMDERGKNNERKQKS